MERHFQNVPSVSIIPEILQQICEVTDNHGNTAPPTYNEICTIIDKLKTSKAAGTDNIIGELIRHGGRNLRQKIHKLICDSWNSETPPAQWSEGIICPFYKKGDRVNCNDYGPLLTYLLIYLLTYLLTYYLLTYLLIYLLIYLFIYLLIYLLTYLLTHSTVQSTS